MKKENIYDQICYMCFVNLYSQAIREDGICLMDFDDKDEEHLFLFEIATQVSAFYNLPIYMNANFLTRLKLYLAHRKAIKWIKFNNKKTKRTVEELLNFMRPAAEETSEDHGIFENIYVTYFARGNK